jgi:TM2 domain-containing membrane protein YozV
MDQKMLMMLPGLQPQEYAIIKSLTQDMNEHDRQQFIMFYSGKRKEEQTILIMTIVGFFGVAGIQRFVTGEVLLGVLFLFTFGFCGIGTIIDLVNHKKITAEWNQKKAYESVEMVRMMKGL